MCCDILCTSVNNMTWSRKIFGTGFKNYVVSYFPSHNVFDLTSIALPEEELNSVFGYFSHSEKCNYYYLFMEKPEWFFRTGVNNEAATGNILYKRCFLKCFQNSLENTYVKVSVLTKLQTWSLLLYLEGDFDSGVFLWILRNF